MPLTNKQKKYLKKHINKKPFNDLVKEAKVSKSEALAYFKKNWRADKYTNFVSSVGPHKKKPRTVKLFDAFLNSSWVYVVLVIVPVLVYAVGLTADFVSDDIYFIATNNRLTDIDYIFRNPLYFLRDIFYAGIYTLFGKTAFFYRLLNLCFHIGSVIFIFKLVTKFENKFVAFLASLLFAVHPILIESVTWISGGPYAQYTFFFLASFYYYLKPGVKHYYVSIVLFVLCLLSSEKSFVTSGVFVLYELSFNREQIKTTYKKTIPFLLFGALWTIYYAFQLGGRYETLTNNFYQQSYITNPLILIPHAFGKYFELFAWPIKLSLYQTEYSHQPIIYLLKLAGTSLYFLAIPYAFFTKRNKLFFWLGFFLIPLVPFILPIGVSWVAAERYVYMSSIAVFFGLSYLTYFLINKYRKVQAVILVLFFALVSFFAVRSVIRNNDWRSEEKLWVATLWASPSSPKAYNNVADVYGKRGDIKASIWALNKAIELKPNYADAYHNLGNAYRREEDIQKAKENYIKALSINPYIWQSHVSLGDIEYQNENYEESLKYFLNAEKLIGSNIEIYLRIADIYKKLDQKESAKEYYEKVLKIDITNIYAQKGLAEL